MCLKRIRKTKKQRTLFSFSNEASHNITFPQIILLDFLGPWSENKFTGWFLQHSSSHKASCTTSYNSPHVTSLIPWTTETFYRQVFTEPAQPPPPVTTIFLFLLLLSSTFLSVSSWQQTAELFLSGYSWSENKHPSFRSGTWDGVHSGGVQRGVVGWTTDTNVRQFHLWLRLRKSILAGVDSYYRWTDTYPEVMVTNTAQDILIRISLPSSTNLQDITVFITQRTVFSKPKHVKTTNDFGNFPNTVLH